MQVKIIANNYIYGIVKRQLNYYIAEVKKIDKCHHEIIFNVSNCKEIELIEKISNYKTVRI